MKDILLDYSIGMLSSICQEHGVEFSDVTSKYDLLKFALPYILEQHTKLDLIELFDKYGLQIPKSYSKNKIIELGNQYLIQLMEISAADYDFFLLKGVNYRLDVNFKTDYIVKNSDLNPYKIEIDKIIDGIVAEDTEFSSELSDNILSSVNNLKTYFRHLVHMESEVFFLREALAQIRFNIAANEYAINRMTSVIYENEKWLIKCRTYNIGGEIERCNEYIRDFKCLAISENLDHIDFSELKKPILPIKPANVKPIRPSQPKKPNLIVPMEPQAPTHLVPNFFNKRSVLRKNAEMDAEYEQELTEYQNSINTNSRLLQKYEHDLIDYKQALSRYNSENEIYKKAMSDYEQQLSEYEHKLKLYNAVQKYELCKNARSIINTKKKKLKTIKQEIHEATKRVIDNLPEVKNMNFLTIEEQNLISQLDRVVKTRNQLLAANVIYDKYRNFVSITSISEYLESGRCDSLTGANGAYNLFESELRSNEIIAKLSTIVSSLESIKENQFILYEEMCEINQNSKLLQSSLQMVEKELMDNNKILSSTNNSTIRMATVINGVASNVDVIACNSAITAHNAMITAHNSKVNADMTGALGFLMAMK